MAIQNWPKTNASASWTSVDGIIWSENQAANTVNDSARAGFRDIANWRDDINSTIATTGSANAYLATSNGSYTSLANGFMLAIKANFSNTGAATINVDSLGVKALRKWTTAGEAALAANDIVNGGHYLIQYNTAANSAAGAWVVLNPSTTVGTDVTANSVTPAQLALGTWTTVASGATVDLGAQTSRNIVISGTTTITSFGTTATSDNVPYLVRFSGILTLTNGANLILPSGANITTAAGDVAEVVWEGSNVWRVVAYNRASGAAVAGGGVTSVAAGTGISVSAATGAVTISAGKIVNQVVQNSTSAIATGSTLIPFDDTIPQNTEGDQYLSQAITPASASSTLIIQVTIVIDSSALVYGVVALFQDATANALAAVAQYLPAGEPKTITFLYKMAAGTTSATTFKVRAGPNTAATLSINGEAAARKLGGVLFSSLTITEILP